MKLIDFKLSEFDSPDEIGSGKKMNRKFLEMLQEARTIADVPFSINSGYRTKKHNLRVGGTPNSSHLKGLACDIKCTTSNRRAIILNALIKVGFKRIGIGNTFIHVDIDEDKPQNVYWLY